ncbi:hypothetical protein GCM10010207_05320 [Streptomyces atratus]|uniref:hypothetical protein n=1 Tax=Streptomyces atratus TaxID=1893 RepID=UPI00166FCF66|nr:hypothetical protein [Streptomyces atratus]GGT09518.1 hypothetical protein GCM10010207_05320 [Streptomyces atratus]
MGARLDLGPAVAVAVAVPPHLGRCRPNPSRPRAAYPDTASAHAAPSAFSAIRRAHCAGIVGRHSLSTPSRSAGATTSAATTRLRPAR